MKTQQIQTLKTLLITFSLNLLFIWNLSGQNKIELNEAFRGIVIDGPVTVFLIHSEYPAIEIEKGQGSRKFEELIEFKLHGGILHIKAIGKELDLQINVYYTALESIVVSGVAKLETRSMLTAQSLNIRAEGASEIDFQIQSDSLNLDASGASLVRLKGTVNSLKVIATGAADVRGNELQANSAIVETKGTADVKLSVIAFADIKATGVSNVHLKSKPEEINTEIGGIAKVKYGDIVEENTLSNNESDIITSCRKKFNGHWGGIEIGLNSLVDRQLNTGMPSGYEFMELNQPKSITVQINFLEQNVPIVHKNFGLVTGLGLWVNNYRFKNNVVLVGDSSVIYGYYDTVQNYLKSKLTTSYLVLPLLFEFQLHNNLGKEIFHIALGGYGAVKLGSKTKVVYLENSKKIKIKDHNDFKINTFKYGFNGRIGWRNLNFFANYNISTMFQKDKGPDVYPFELGITILGW